MDFADFKSGSAPLNIVNPATGKPTGLVLDMLYVRDESPMQAHKDYAARIAKAKSQGDEQSIIDALEKERDIVCLARSITGWDWGGNTLNGEVPEFSEKNVKKLLENSEVAEQALNFTVVKTNFFQGLNTGS